MATFVNIDKVCYQCICGRKHPLCRLYLCRHCYKLRCGDCLLHEVDSYFCPCCLDSMHVDEAKLKKNRCGTCYDCPSCGHLLSIRATNVAQPNPEDPSKTIPKKMYYLACGFCRWTTRDVGISDQPVATGCWQDLVNPHEKRISALLEYYKKLAGKEKAEKEREKYIKRRGQLYFSDKFGISSMALKRKTTTSSLKDGEQCTLSEIQPSKTVIDFPALPEEIFTQPLDLNKITKINQRLVSPSFQPTHVSQLYPSHKHLQVRKSIRCKECDHNLIKPDYNSASIKFKIQSTAMYHIPELKILAAVKFLHQKESQVSLSLSNPAVYNVDVTLLPMDEEEQKCFATAKVELPKQDLVIGRKDDYAIHESSNNTQSTPQNESNMIKFLQASKIGFNIGVTPLFPEGQVLICFIVRHSYKNVSLNLPNEKEEPQTVWLEHKIFVNLGSVCPE